MATWQQGINSGGFLAGIGAQNENAPKASDINATLGLIRENNDLARSGANNVALTGLRGLAGVADIYKQEQQQKALNAFNQVHANAWATGDNSGLIKFAQENPAFVAQAQQAFSGLNEQQRNDMGDLAMKANVALSQGPEAYSKFITDNKDRLNRVGANPDWMIQTGVQNPEQLSHMLATMTLGAAGPDKMLDYQDKMVGRQQEQQRINETIRNNDMTNARGIRGQNISASNSAADRQIRLMQLKQDALVKQATSETNDLKKQELQLKIESNQQALQEKQQQVQKGKDMSYEAAKLARSIASNPQLDVVTGSIQSRLPKFEGESLDIINQAQQLQSMLTAGNLGLLKGAMSDKDIAFLQSMSSGLNVGDNGIKGSYEATKKKLNIIADKLERNLGGYVPDGEQVSAGTQSPQTVTTKSWSDLP
ncbi:DNA transfer protein [Salmonella enterica]|uniref:DNA transfer protein n=1 Tax=Salmonella enterica TaxID=28901 RepID=UPI00255AA9EF|nr:DNA transfer protein [Salmonella enterica]MDL4076696.1 DNA transfer protein [Salmonella enterica]MDL4085600.1 DNA transfer protein [Salmonella enterica]MDL4114681.1 DNA transfer protein [Salmonella enterica]